MIKVIKNHIIAGAPLILKRYLYKLIHPNKKVNSKESINLLEAEKKRLERLPRFQSDETPLLGNLIKITDAASFLYLYKEIFEYGIYRFNASTSAPYIIDCGANIGLSILYFKKLYPKAEILAFEPDKNIFEILRFNIESFGLTDITLIDKGVWNEETTLKFYTEGADGGRIVGNTDNGLNLISIQTTRLREFLQKPVDFLKIDIEGAETIVLEDCKDLLINVKNLFVEYHSYIGLEQTLDKVLKILKEAGFRYSIQQHGVVSMNAFVEVKNQDNMDILLNISAYRI